MSVSLTGVHNESSFEFHTGLKIHRGKITSFEVNYDSISGFLDFSNGI